MGPPRPGTRWLAAAAVLGLAHALVSLLWLFGSPWLLDTVGGQLERWGREGGAVVRLALLCVVLAKVTAVGALWLAVQRRGRFERLVAGVAGAVLTVYGGVLTIAGIAIVCFGAADISRSSDPRALRWHAFFWDPWFLLWGACTLAALRASRRR
ncbi:DUF3995 domain-containing protein [Aeromicrobium fastidiosum]|uniref:DUF3995 domain-containing protein n=2 Tax=Aeromicrobium fastidiosum TaxID=52699 RepID=A0A641AH58_9ACTN|nr:DUF3995 domain-containing protein [Aeromicrobium fastidiosum]KAA1372240.1 DUF3995 domain-containing protein [Aeromicrobium fastidiosum]MBP2391379.1 putative membrane protein [Aeromicrobium fastidiosum]